MLTMKVQTGQLTEIKKLSYPKENIYYSNIPHGKKFKMWGVARNNISETAALNAKWGNIRCTIPPISISIWIKNSLRMVDKFLHQINDLYKEEIPYTSIGIRFLKKIKKNVYNID